MADSTIKQGSTPTITIHVTRDLSDLRCVVVFRATGVEDIVRDVTPERTEDGCTIVLALTEAECMALMPGGARVEVAAYDPNTKTVIKTKAAGPIRRRSGANATRASVDARFAGGPKTPVRRGHGQPSHAPVTRGGVFVQELYKFAKPQVNGLL